MSKAAQQASREAAYNARRSFPLAQDDTRQSGSPIPTRLGAGGKAEVQGATV